MKHTLTSGPVSEILEMTRQSVRRHDAELQPIRSGRIRLYDPDVVERVRARRAAQRNAEAQKR